jgi:Mrp family chromosome partitioning ATPase
MKMQDDTTRPNEEDKNREGPGQERGNLVRLLKPIVVSPDLGGQIDDTVVASRYYDCFNYSLISREKPGVNLTVGITSPNPGDGKTLVASNLAVSLATANQRETILVDLNVRSPQIHTIFGTKLGPGLAEAISDRPIHVSQTRIKHLYVLSAGYVGKSPIVTGRVAAERRSSQLGSSHSSVSLEQVAEFRDVIYSLKQEFEFVIVDMPVLQEPRIPMLLTLQMDGLLVVVDARRTKREEIDRMLVRLNRNQILGFVLNRADIASLG